MKMKTSSVQTLAPPLCLLLDPQPGLPYFTNCSPSTQPPAAKGPPFLTDSSTHSPDTADKKVASEGPRVRNEPTLSQDLLVLEGQVDTQVSLNSEGRTSHAY